MRVAHVRTAVCALKWKEAIRACVRKNFLVEIVSFSVLTATLVPAKVMVCVIHWNTVGINANVHWVQRVFIVKLIATTNAKVIHVNTMVHVKINSGTTHVSVHNIGLERIVICTIPSSKVDWENSRLKALCRKKITTGNES